MPWAIISLIAASEMTRASAFDDVVARERREKSIRRRKVRNLAADQIAASMRGLQRLSMCEGVCPLSPRRRLAIR